MIVGIILAGGKGTRIKSRDRNKVTLPFLNKPMICYAVELLTGICEKVIVVVGAFHESVIAALSGYDVSFVHQKKRLGTGHAVRVAIDEVEAMGLSPTLVLVAYGDHTMFYQKKTIHELIAGHKTHRAAVSIITTVYDKPDELAWGRIMRNAKGTIVKIVEQKDANPKERKISEINAGFYCFDFAFLKDSVSKMKKSAVTGEYYLTDLVEIALAKKKKVFGLRVPFAGVGIGINRYQELEESERIYLKNKR